MRAGGAWSVYFEGTGVKGARNLPERQMLPTRVLDEAPPLLPLAENRMPIAQYHEHMLVILRGVFGGGWGVCV